jgi:hypothetical protein
MPEYLLRLAHRTGLRDLHAASTRRGLVCRADMPAGADLPRHHFAVRYLRGLRARLQRVAALLERARMRRGDLHRERAKRGVPPERCGVRLLAGPRVQRGERHVRASAARRPRPGLRRGRQSADPLRRRQLRSRCLRRRCPARRRLRSKRPRLRQPDAVHPLFSRRRRNDRHVPAAGERQLSVRTAASISRADTDVTGAVGAARLVPVPPC